MKNISKILIGSFICLFFSFLAQAQEVNQDSLARKQKQFAKQLDSIKQRNTNYPKNLLKLLWIYNRPNTPWVLPNGIRYERIWGRNSTYETGFSFSASNGSLIEYAIYGEARYYFRKRKNNYTFKGFFLRGGLVYSYQKVTNFPNLKPVAGHFEVGGLLGGFGYQAVFWKKLSTEIGFATSAGWYKNDFREANKLDAFQWTEIGIKLGYAF
jgi:hypothetical protein